MATSMAERKPDTPRRDRPRWRVLGIGALAGLVAGLFLTLLQALARLWAGVAPPSELIADRIAPLLRVEQFLQSNAMWVGVPMRDLITQANPEDGVVEVLLRGVDGYTDTFAIAKAMEPTTLVAYQMNGEPLPERHGFPARVIVPGLFGEKNVKWVTRIDLVTEDAKGFYEH